MALQSSGTIKMSEINTELGRSSTATISLDTAENGGYATINTSSASYPSASNPASMSEWYGYDHSASSSSGYEGTLSRDAYTESGEACSLSAVDTVYKDGSSSSPASADQLYSDSSLSTNLSPNPGFGKWYKYIDVDGGNVEYIVYLLEGGSGECVIETYEPC